jgi:hypothetical protein
MKMKKGKAAFDSVDEVLAGRIVSNARDHGGENGPARETSAAGASSDATAAGGPTPSGKHRGRGIIIAACAGIALFLIGLALFRGMREYRRR